MKVLIVPFLIFSSFIYAQTYKKLLDHNSEWHLTNCFSGCVNDIYFTDGDTLHNNFNYKILNGFHYISREFWLREDTINKKVYLNYPHSDFKKNEKLLYDFSLQVGDSIFMYNPISSFPENGGYYTVDSIISKTLQDGESYKHFFFSPSSSNTYNERPVWIEGIGSLSLINSPGGTPDVNRVGKLSCYFNGNQLVYTQLDSIKQCKKKSFSNIKHDENQWDIYPSIATYTVNLMLKKSISSMKIFSVLGNQVFYKKGLHTNILSVNVSKFKNGIYFVQLTSKDNNAFIIKKFIKQ